MSRARLAATGRRVASYARAAGDRADMALSRAEGWLSRRYGRWWPVRLMVALYAAGTVLALLVLGAVHLARSLL